MYIDIRQIDTYKRRSLMERRRPAPRTDHDPREQLADTLHTLEAGSIAILDSASCTHYLTALRRLYAYGFGTVALILAQRPEATPMAGYRRWQALGRQVNTGEQGIRMLVPHTRVVALEHGEEDVVVRAFGVGAVCDVSQTEGEPVPEPPVAAELRTSSAAGRLLNGYTETFLTLDRDAGARVPEPAPGRPDAQGCWLPGERMIRVKTGLADETSPYDDSPELLVLHGQRHRHVWRRKRTASPCHGRSVRDTLSPAFGSIGRIVG